MTLLNVTGLAVGAGGRTLLAGIDLCLQPGERVGLVGPSGLGKSTLLRAIAGLVDPVAGRSGCGGNRPDSRGWPAFRRQLVLLAQKPSLLPGSVAQNLARPFQYASSQSAFPEQRARDGLLALGLDAACWEQEANSLSVGQQQRVCLLRALLVDPAVLLLDEPSSALDSESVEAAALAIIEACDTRGLAVLLVSHDAALRDRLCGRSLDLDAFIPPKEV